MHLPNYCIQRNVQLLGHGPIEFADGMFQVVVGFKEQPVEGACLQRLRIEVMAETEIESVGQQLFQLLGRTAVAMPDDGLAGMEFVADAQHVVDGTHAMQEKRKLQFFA